MTRGEVAIVLGALLCAVGVGLWVHPGAGVVVGGIGLGLFGVVEIRFAEEPVEATDGREPAEDLAA